MIFKKEINRLSSLFTLSSVFWLASHNLTSAQDWNYWFSQSTGVIQSTISDDADKSFFFQKKTTSNGSLRSELANWLTLSANLDSTYRNTNFDGAGHHTIISQGDSRLEFWMPPGRDEFSWGPYVRFAGLTSDRSPAWENAWLAQPGYGINVYPFSSVDYRKENEKSAKLLGPLRLFGEYNRQDYWGSENIWRTNEQIRVGADYWKALHVNNTFMPWWTEAWSGLFWQSANEFDKDYNTFVFGNAVRVGLRKPDAGILSVLTPYLAIESSLTENKQYYWENRLLLGGGIRFAPFLFEKKDESSWLNRFVVFAEYLGVAAYYRESAPSSIPDYDFRIGISLSIGEWYRTN